MREHLVSMERDDRSSSVPYGNGDGAATNAPTQRRSGRAVKKPEFFAPSASTPQESSRGKRKRVEEHDDDNSSVENGHESSVDGSEEERDEVVVSAKARKGATNRKPLKTAATKRAKTSTARTSTLPLRTVATKPASKPRRRGRKASTASTETEGIYGEIFSRESDAQEVAAGWVSKYERHNTEAIRDLVNFVLKASGCPLEVTVHDVEDQDNVTGKLGDLQDEYQAQAVTEYPLISRGKRTPQVRTALEGFFGAVVASANVKSILFDDPGMLENIQLWVTTMSSSSLRPFRHTATFVALTILSALCEVAAEITESLATTSRQLEGEKKKSRRNKERVGALEKRVKEGNDKYAVIEGIIRDLFDTVFVHRYRDVDPKIRVECVQALGHWISTLSDVFFDESYLRYLGWVLSDTYPATRLEVLRQLQKLYKKSENIGGLTTFTERFRPRTVEMATRDADITVRVLAIELVDIIRAVGLLEPADIDAVGKLIFDSEARVRRAVVKFFAESVDELCAAKIEELGGEEALEDVLPDDADESIDIPKLPWLKLKCLVEMFQAYEAEDEDAIDPLGQGAHGVLDALAGKDSESRLSLATKACYEVIPEVRDWETLTGYLLFDHSESATSSNSEAGNSQNAFRQACRISEEQEIILLEALNASVRLCLTDPEQAAPAGKSRKPKKPAKASSESLEATALQLAQLLPRLLNKFGPVPAAASAVLRLEHVLDLEVFQQLRQDSTTYAALLDDINKQFVSHSSQSVLAEASAALLHALTFEDLHEVTEAKVQQLWEDTTRALQLLVQDKDVIGDELVSTGCLKEMLDTVRRITSLAGISDCIPHFERSSRESGTEGEPSLQILIKLLCRGLPENEHELDEESKQMNEQLVVASMKSLMFYFMWRLRHLQQTVADLREVPPAEVAQLREYRDAFAENLAHIMQKRTGADTLRQLATGTFLDLHTLFATLRQLAEKPADATEAVKESVGRVRSLITVVSEEHEKLVGLVYAAAEKAFAKKSRRKIEPAEDDAPVDDEMESESESDDEDNDDTEDAARERERSSLMLEQRLCELTGKIVLAILAGVLDSSGQQAGKIKERITRNRGRLGRNFKEVVAYLDEPSSKKTAKQPAGAKAKATEKANAHKSAERAATEESAEEEEEEVQGQEGVEEGDVEDLRRRELEVDDEDRDHNDENNNENDDDGNAQALSEHAGSDVLGD